jgi:hypothetical protein
MIYLIDDNQADQRLVSYSLGFVDDNTYADILVSKTKLPSYKDKSYTGHLAFLKDAKCILIHSTTEAVDERGEFIKGEISNVVKIVESISASGLQIPVVMFSNGRSEELVYDFRNNPNFIQQIKKNKFYSRLYDFLEHYKSSGLIELRILAYGKNFQQHELEQAIESILMNIIFKSDTDMLKISDLSGVLSDFRHFVKAAGLKYTADELLEKIEDSPMTVGNFRENINSISESYTKHGKNIHDWL